MNMKLNQKYRNLIFTSLAAISLAGCYYDKEDQLYPPPVTPMGNTCDTASVSYATTVKPIIKQYCTDPNCHSGNGTTGAYLLTTYDGLNAIANTRLLGAIKQESGYLPMPQGMAKLSDCDINKVSAWVHQGALNN